MRCWDDIRDDFRRAVFDQGPRTVADAIPADLTTVYRLVSGKITRPHRATILGIERLLTGESLDGRRSGTDN